MTRVLSLDDDSAMLELISLILQRAGYEHVCTRDSQEALRVMRAEPVDLFTQDIMRPDLDGWEFYRLMKSEPGLRDIPVLIVTCQAQSKDRFAGLRLARVDGYLTKPFGPQELLEALETILRAHAKSPPSEEDRRRAQIRREQAALRRAQLLRAVVSNLANVRLENYAALIDGHYGRYEVSTSSGRVMRLPNQRLCIVPERSNDCRLLRCVPFEDTDISTEQIVSTILMLANDRDICDPAILKQLKECPHDG